MLSFFFSGSENVRNKKNKNFEYCKYKHYTTGLALSFKCSQFLLRDIKYRGVGSKFKVGRA